MTNSMNDLVQTVNYAAMQNDRWLMLASFSLLLLIMAWVARWLINKNEQITKEKRADQLSYEAKLEEIVAVGNKTATTLAVSLERNSCAIESNTEILEKCTEELRECRAARNGGHR